MTDETETQAQVQAQVQGSGAPLRYVPLGKDGMELLRDGDTAAAGDLLGLRLGDDFVDEEARWLWNFRLGQMAQADAAQLPWLARQIGVDAEGAAVGHAGFHGPPDENGMVEVGYVVLPAHRRRGHARAMLTELLRRAGADPAVRTVRAAIRPDNAASLATIAPFGFVRTGEQWDEIDGRELLFELGLEPRR